MRKMKNRGKISLSEMKGIHKRMMGDDHAPKARRPIRKKTVDNPPTRLLEISVLAGSAATFQRNLAILSNPLPIVVVFLLVLVIGILPVKKEGGR
jgi:hypothetical protein